jgi:hypothetical protein
MRESHRKSTLDLLLYIPERKKVHVLCSVRYFSPFQYQPFFSLAHVNSDFVEKITRADNNIGKRRLNLTDKWRGKALCFRQRAVKVAMNGSRFISLFAVLITRRVSEGLRSFSDNHFI